MPASQKATPDLVLSDATPEDVEKLAPVFSHSFHPTSDYMRAALPDTPDTRIWWAQVHSYAITERNIRLVKVVDENTNEFVALCRWRVHDREDVRTNREMVETWNVIPLPSEANTELCDAFITFQREARAKWMSGTPHILVELVLTADEYKGKGAGKMMIEQLCREADEAGLECFVETNGPVVAFYQKFGFVLRETVEMPGGYGYTENILVRPARGSNGPAT